MPTIYTKADDEAVDLIKSVMKKHHKKLHEAGVTIDAVFACAETDEDGNPKGNPVKLAGYVCAATIQRANLKQRALGHADAIITIDGDQWNDFSNEEREALIDHELTHMVPQWEDGKLVTDDLGRPKLKTRLHDWQLGGFAEVVERHGQAALECQMIRRVEQKHGQLLFGFASV